MVAARLLSPKTLLECACLCLCLCLCVFVCVCVCVCVCHGVCAREREFGGAWLRAHCPSSRSPTPSRAHARRRTHGRSRARADERTGTHTHEAVSECSFIAPPNSADSSRAPACRCGGGAAVLEMGRPSTAAKPADVRIGAACVKPLLRIESNGRPRGGSALHKPMAAFRCANGPASTKAQPGPSALRFRD